LGGVGGGLLLGGPEFQCFGGGMALEDLSQGGGALYSWGWDF